MSSTRVRFSRVSCRRFSVSRRRSLYFDTPAASSRNTRSSSGLRLDDPRDHALADDGVGARAETGAEEDVLDVAAAHRQVVDVVARGAVAREHALDGDFGVLAPLAGGAAVGVVEHQFDAGAAAGLARRRAVEDHVLHRLAAQLGGARFAEHPAHGIDDVGLAAAVRARPRRPAGPGPGNAWDRRMT